MRIFLLLFILYLYNFYKLGNTLFRTNSTGIKVFSPLSIIESFIGPIRSLYILLVYQDFNAFIHYLQFELTNIASPYFYIIVFIIIKKINKEYNKVSQKNQRT